MYESFFELNQRPFPTAPLATRYVPNASMEAARAAISRCIDRAEGSALLVGPSGSGKTLLCQVLAEQFRSRFAVVQLFSGHLATRRELLQAILFELGLSYRGLEEGELRLSLIDHLTRSDKCSQGLLLLIDEAHTLPLKLLEEVRMMTNLVRQGEPCVRLLLAGSGVLEEHFASPKLASFSQRLAARCYLEPLDRAETFDYVRTQIRLVSGDPARLFNSDALEAVYRASDGIARLINQVCDHALVLGFQAGKRPVGADLVEAAWADLQQLPTPWNSGAQERQPRRAEAGDVIEFGALDDEPESPAELRLTLPFAVAEDRGSTASRQNGPGSDVEAGLTEMDLVFDDFSSPEGSAELTSPVHLSEQVELDFGDDCLGGNELVFEATPDLPTQACLPQLEQHVAMPPVGRQANESHSTGAQRFAAAAPPLPAEVAIYERPLYEASTVEAKDFDSRALEPGRFAPQPAERPLIQFSTQDPFGADAEPVDSTATPSSDGQPLWEEPASSCAAGDESTSAAGDESTSAAGDNARDNLESLMAPEEVEVVFEEQAVEELVVDHYGRLDAMKGKGNLPKPGTHKAPPSRHPPLRPLAPEPVRTTAAISISAEKTLTLAEALVRQATAVEQTALGTSAPIDTLFTVLSAAAADDSPRDAWNRVDLFAPTPGDTPEPAPGRVLEGSGARTPHAGSPQAAPRMVPFPAATAWEAAEPEELALIVVEDDPHEVLIETASQAQPVKRQEFKQLFARLRKN